MIDMTKKYQTKDGFQVRIYATDCGGEFPIHGALLGDDCMWHIGFWRECDLVEVPETVVTWQNVYQDHDSRLGADRAASTGRVAVVRIERTGDKVQCFVEEVFAQ